MSQFTGMNIGEVRSLSNQLKTQAGEIQRIAQQLGSTLQGAAWVGPDRERFVSEWQGQHMSQITAVVNALEQASQIALQNANDQEATSNA